MIKKIYRKSKFVDPIVDRESIVNRINWVDTVKYICIMFVMLSHLESNTPVLRILYGPFFLTGFFFVSGYVYKHTSSFKTFILKKIRGLFIPWLIFSTFNICLSSIVSLNEHTSFFNEIGWNFLQVRGHGDGVWFVAALFVTFIPFYFLIDWYEKKEKERILGMSNTTILILMSLMLSIFSVLFTKVIDPQIFPWKDAVLPWHLEYIFQAMFFMVLGYVFCKKYEKTFDRYNTSNNRIIIILIYLLLIYTPFILSISSKELYSTIYKYCTQIVGCTVIVASSKKIKSNKYISFVGQNTIIYFALHGKILSICQTFFRRGMEDTYGIILNNVVASSAFAIAFSIMLSIVLIIPSHIINRWIPFVLGRKKKRVTIATPFLK